MPPLLVPTWLPLAPAEGPAVGLGRDQAPYEGPTRTKARFIGLGPGSCHTSFRESKALKVCGINQGAHR